ncbi:hypothetical protein PCANC_21719 [Puccinia coronata f. sp. avenae]|uniref:GAR domain-containing protein n=1 Tax=Puccinia coronata f. sp. avenae TaxID=200324 RepID=A0A2N5SDX7_9BASI|nr:hypothetical protein PCANC_21719 [Puccinia coronata f. sp. avenae]PLW33258.1 hypothetical protein PCASD_09768 [Puccinia coronata f. sp. avenae]
MTTTGDESSRNDSTNHSDEKATKLNNQLVELLEGLNNRKSRIDEQVKFLLNLPKILPFEPLPPDPSKISRKTWETWWAEHDRIEQEAGFFREDEFALMKKVAMSKTTNMSREDTDLVGLTLGTLEAFSKLEHLLRSRRKQLQILDLRIKWDQQTSKVWQDLTELETQLPLLLSKIRWTPPSPIAEQQLHFNTAPPPPPPLPSSPPFPSGSCQSPPNSLSRSLRSRKEVADSYNSSPQLLSLDSPLFTRSSTRAEQSSDNLPSSPLSDPSTSTSSIQYSLNPNFPHQLQRVEPSPRFRNTISCIRTTSAPTCNTSGTSSVTLPSSYSSAQSRAMRIQSLALQLSSVSTKFHTLNRSVIPTSNTIDKLIDSGLHVPEVFLDLQDKLEASVRSLKPTETGKFYTALMEQHKEADDTWFNFFHLGLEIESSKREIDRLLTAAQIDPLHLVELGRQFDQLSEKYDAQDLRTQLRILPTHPNYPDQPQFNKRLVDNLQNASKRVKSELDKLDESVETYRFAAGALEESKLLRASMEESKHKLMENITAIENLNKSYPNRAWLMNDPNCLAPQDKDMEYEREWGKIMVEMKENVSAALNLLETAKGVLKKLNAPGGDPNVRSDCCRVGDALKKSVYQAQQISTTKEESVHKLSQIRSIWQQILATQSEVGRLRDQLLLDAYREKWRMRKVSPVSPTSPPQNQFVNLARDPSPRGLPSFEELRRPAALSPALFHTPQNAEIYLLESLQPLVNSMLDELGQHLTVHQHVMQKFDELRTVQVPQLVKLEAIVELIRSQTSQVQKVEFEYDAKVIEGGRWMKKVQDLIGVELEYTYEEAEEPAGRTDSQARLVQQSRLTQTMTQLNNYLHTIDQFCNSLSNRIPFIAASHSDPLVMQNGRVVLHCQAHDESVRSYLNGLSMYLMGLKSQISNESILLEWTNSTHVKEFEQAVENVRTDIQITNVKLQTFKADVQRLQNLIESDPYEPFLTDVQIEQAVDKPLHELGVTLDEIEIKLSQSASVHLEAFIASCPSSSSSGAFQTDQFILPKQMAHHQLQALYNQTRRELEDIHLLASVFKNETNSRRKDEVSWRVEWTRLIDELTSDCGKLEGETLTVESEITRVRQELVDWDQNQFKAVGQGKLMEVNDPLPEYLDDILRHQLELSELNSTLATIQSKHDGVQKRATAVKLDIEARLPVFSHLSADLFTLIEQLRCQWTKSYELGLQVSASTAQLTQDVGAYLEEYERRVNWKDQCCCVTGVELQTIDESFVRFDEVFDQSSISWRSFTEGETNDNEADQNLHALLELSRLLNNYKTTDFNLIQSNIEVSQARLSAIRQEVSNLSSSDVPHVYLANAEAQVGMRMNQLRHRFANLEAVESELSTWLCRLTHVHESRLEDQLEQDIISKHYEAEQAQLTDWGRTDLDQFINQVSTEGQQFEQLLAANEILPPQAPIDTLFSNTTASLSYLSMLADTMSDMQDQVMMVDNMVKSASDMSQRLEILGVTQEQLAETIVSSQQTLPSQCSKHLDEILNQQQPLEVKDDNGSNRFELASSNLQDIQSNLKSLNSSLQARLESANEKLQSVQKEIAQNNVLSSFCDRLRQLGLDGLVDTEASSSYSPLPTQDVLDQALQILDEASGEIEKIPKTIWDHKPWQDSLNFLEDQRHIATNLGPLVDFHSKVSECDRSFSTLIDILDVRQMDTTENEIDQITESAQQAFDALLKSSENVSADPRVEYHATRSRHTWEELLSIIKENKSEPQNDLRRSTTRGSNPLSSSVRPPISNRSRSRLATVSRAPSLKTSTPNSSIPRARQPSIIRNQFESPTVSDSPNGFMNSPSYMPSRRYAKTSLDASHVRSNLVIPKCESNTAAASVRSMSRQSESKNPMSPRSNTSFTQPRQRLHSIQSTPTRPAAKLLANRTSGTTNITPTPYKPQPNRNIDKLVGNVVNKLARNQFTVHVAPADGWEDNSGMYWIGDKIYFCRILRSQTVMVRIGGGWSELSAFLMEHLRLTTLNNTSQMELRATGGSERVASGEHTRRSSTSHSMLLPGSVISSCDSSPHSRPTNDGRRSDSSNSTPTSSIATVLINTSHQARTSNGPSPNERINLSHSTSQPASFSSTPTETIQMFLRKAENRSYLSNNYIPSPHNDGPSTTDAILKFNRSNFPPLPGSKLEPSALPASLTPSHHSSPSLNLNTNTNTSNNKTSSLRHWKP